jgi:hypothetical protein
MVAMVMLVMVGALYLSCSRLRTNGDDFITVSGSVIDSTSQIPIDSARLELGGDWIAYTDTAGSFTFRTPSIFETTFSAGKNGYITSSKVLKDIGYDTSGIVFELVRAR